MKVGRRKQESQTETPYENSSTYSSSTQQQHQYYKGPLYLQPGPQNQLFLVSADYLQSNGQNIQGMPLNPNIQVGQRLPQQNIMIEMLTNEQKNQQILPNADGCRRPVTIQCPFCQSIGITRVKNEISGQGMCCVFLLLISLPILFWLPFYMRECQQAKSFCFRCHRQVGFATGSM
ncbi:hypothetical protein pb186bvf_016426 [Paramecium bursaria]